MLSFFYNQLFVSVTCLPTNCYMIRNFQLPYPNKDFSGQTIIVTGSNVGLGLEAARHFTRLNAEKIILAVRNLEKGDVAKKSIEESTGRTGVIEV